MSARTSVNFSDEEYALAKDAARAAGIRFNAWVRRAVRETAALERSLGVEVEPRVGLEREGVDVPAEVGVLLARVPERAFRPDPRPVGSKQKRR